MNQPNKTRLAYTINSPLGKLVIHTQDQKIVKLDFATKTPASSTEASMAVANELTAYFKNAKHKFNLPLNLEGSEFQRRVWQALCNIPAGETQTYGTLAKQLKTSARAIGQACKKNPIPIIVPCHRVVGAHHQGGYMGKTEGNQANIKSWLLAHEQSS